MQAQLSMFGSGCRRQLTAALALLPLAVTGNFPGQEIEYPMAFVILGGLVTSTFLNLFVLPVGAWMHGANNVRAGMMMPGEPLLGAKYYQEVAPDVAMDSANIVDVHATLSTPDGQFTGCLTVQKENPLDGEQEFQTHAPGIGLIQDEDLSSLVAWVCK